MTETDLSHEATDICDQLPDSADVEPAEIHDKLTTLVEDYQVPTDEARRSIMNNYLDDTNIDPDDGDMENQTVSISEIDKPEEWVDLTAKVVELWEPRSDAIGQVGLLGDETGTIKFTAWAKSDLPALSEGHAYHLQNLVTDEYQGQYSVKLNSTTTIEDRDQEIEVGDNSTELAGALVDIQQGSGLIKRCPADDCTRVLQNGRCSEHGEQEGDFDLRIKGVLDDGDTVQDVIFGKEETEAVSGISLAEAQERAMDALDTSVVTDDIQDATLGQYYRVSGPIMGRYLLVDEFERLGQMDDPDQILIRARSM
ncbi:replication factor A [Halovenus salina]|uniref:Replication factor A n=1 Tax=Halovenus salina TaxID=1510225 RepID=A0ABD5W9H1_9EURY|nr:replication factor A [Halovenus salina]